MIEVVKIDDITGDDMVARELALIRVNANNETRTSILEIAQIFRANVIDVAPDSLILEVTGTDTEMLSNADRAE